MRKKKNKKKITLEVWEMNKRIIKEKLQDPMYIPSSLDRYMLAAGEYRANIKKVWKNTKKKS